MTVAGCASQPTHAYGRHNTPEKPRPRYVVLQSHRCMRLRLRRARRRGVSNTSGTTHAGTTLGLSMGSNLVPGWQSPGKCTSVDLHEQICRSGTDNILRHGQVFRHNYYTWSFMTTWSISFSGSKPLQHPHLHARPLGYSKDPDHAAFLVVPFAVETGVAIDKEAVSGSDTASGASLLRSGAFPGVHSCTWRPSQCRCRLSGGMRRCPARVAW